MPNETCDVMGCGEPAIYVPEAQELGDLDHHDCVKHLLASAKRHEDIAARLRKYAGQGGDQP